MKNTISVLVVEDNEYYNNLLSKTLQQSLSSVQLNNKVQIVLNSFTDPYHFIRNIKSGKFMHKNTIAFVDYYMGDGINGAHLTRLLKKHNKESVVVLLSQSKAIEEKNVQGQYDYFVTKDMIAPSLCRLYLEQFIDKIFL